MGIPISKSVILQLQLVGWITESLKACGGIGKRMGCGYFVCPIKIINYTIHQNIYEIHQWYIKIFARKVIIYNYPVESKD